MGFKCWKSHKVKLNKTRNAKVWTLQRTGHVQPGLRPINHSKTMENLHDKQSKVSERQLERVFRIKDDRMSDGTKDGIPNGADLYCNPVTLGHLKAEFEDGRHPLYVLTVQGGACTALIKGVDLKGQKLECYSLNPDKDRYPDRIIPIGQILEYYAVNAVSIKRVAENQWDDDPIETSDEPLISSAS